MDYYQKIDGDAYLKDGVIVPKGEPKTWDEMYGEDFEKVPNSGFGIHRLEWYCKMLEAIGGKKGKVASLLIKGKDSRNVYLGRVQDIVVESGVSLQTVNDALKAMRQADVIKSMTCALMVNPGCEHKGNRKREAYLMKEYATFGQKKFKTLEETRNYLEANANAIRESDD